MPGHLQEGFGCVVTNRFDQLLDDESDPFEVIQAAESRKKESGGGGVGGGGGGGSSSSGGGSHHHHHQGSRGSGGGGGGSVQATQANSSGGSGQAGIGSGSAAKQLRRESQKERKNPLPPFAASSGPGGAGDRREDGGGQPGAAPLRKEGESERKGRKSLYEGHWVGGREGGRLLCPRPQCSLCQPRFGYLEEPRRAVKKRPGFVDEAASPVLWKLAACSGGPRPIDRGGTSIQV